MTRKDYELLAGTIRAEVETYSGVPYGAAKVRALQYLAHRLTTNLKADNPRFDERRFMAAAGFTEES